MSDNKRKAYQSQEIEGKYVAIRSISKRAKGKEFQLLELLPSYLD